MRLEAAEQGKREELDSLLLIMDEHRDKLVQMADDAAEAKQQAETAYGQQQAAEAEMHKLQHENVNLRESLAKMATEENEMHQKLQQAQVNESELRDFHHSSSPITNCLPQTISRSCMNVKFGYLIKLGLYCYRSRRKN